MKNVLVLVVTYNRLNDLKVCIDAIKKQTYTDFDILVVNNGSSHGTKEWLESVNDVLKIHQTNLGGAGGFYTGMKYMFENGYEWLLMMDDDGIPDKDELKNLIESYDYVKSSEGKDCIVNSLVADKNHHTRTSFLWARGSNRSNSIPELQKDFYFSDIHPFNGTLIKRCIIEKLGFVKKEMFIWGDEEEYMARARYNGFGTCTITSAIHYHPKEKGDKGYLLPFNKRFYILVKPSKMSHYYYRNKGYIYFKYPEKKSHIISFCIGNTIYDLLHFRFKELIKFYIYFLRGARNKY
jgi:rhamnopyranosyl-N-acetylglucosaminyl-diphospho-decaprenol beta-1,3/1,4-galactofuranosyltransferase